MLLILASENRITKGRARAIATRIHMDNPLITDQILDEFSKKLKGLHAR